MACMWQKVKMLMERVQARVAPGAPSHKTDVPRLLAGSGLWRQQRLKVQWQEATWTALA